MKKFLLFILTSTSSFAVDSHFECRKESEKVFRPYYFEVINNGTQYREWPDLGQNSMSSQSECDSALKVANHKWGVVCSRTGLDGWKPTLYTGTVPGRPDFGYLGGSSIMRFEDCLKATEFSSEKGVCYWGGSDWYIAPINKEGSIGGPFKSIEACTLDTK